MCVVTLKGPITKPIEIYIPIYNTHIYICIYLFHNNRNIDQQTDTDECVSTKLRVAGNLACFILVILNCTHI